MRRPACSASGWTSRSSRAPSPLNERKGPGLSASVSRAPSSSKTHAVAPERVAVHREPVREAKDPVGSPEPARSRQGHRPRHGTGRRTPAAAHRQHVQLRPGRRDPGQRPEEPAGLGPALRRDQLHGREEVGRLRHPPDPPVRQWHLRLGERLLDRGDLELFGSHCEVQEVVAADASQCRTERLVDVDVGGPEAHVAAAQAVAQQVEPRVHPVAHGERLEAQPVAARGHHRIEVGESLGEAEVGVARARDVGDGQQSRGRDVGPAHEPAEEARGVDEAARASAPDRSAGRARAPPRRCSTWMRRS